MVCIIVNFSFVILTVYIIANFFIDPVKYTKLKLRCLNLKITYKNKNIVLKIGVFRYRYMCSIF